MSIDYKTWPGPKEALARVKATGVTLRGDEEEGPRELQCCQAVVAEIEKRTGRQFIPGPADEVRYFDGNGTPELEVDEMVTLASVAVVGIQSSPGYGVTNALLIQEQGKPQTRITVARGGLGQWAAFPSGRQNIAVTGTFGYAATIPADLWEAAACEMALRLAAEGAFVAEGRLIAFEGAGVKERYAVPETDALTWRAQYERVLGSSPKGYQKPQGRRLRNLRPRMI